MSAATEHDEQESGPDHSPEFSRRAAVVLQSPYWTKLTDGAPDREYMAVVQRKRALRESLEEAIMKASDYDALPDDVRKVFDEAEAATKG